MKNEQLLLEEALHEPWKILKEKLNLFLTWIPGDLKGN